MRNASWPTATERTKQWYKPTDRRPRETATRATGQLHSVRKVETNVIATRKLSCFCPPCMDGTSDKCINKNFVDPWGTFKLNVSHTVAEDACHGEAVQERVPLPRDDYFSNLQSEMQTFKSYHELEMVVSASQASDYPRRDGSNGQPRVLLPRACRKWRRARLPCDQRY